jgi:hypothetical protein
MDCVRHGRSGRMQLDAAIGWIVAMVKAGKTK